MTSLNFFMRIIRMMDVWRRLQALWQPSDFGTRYFLNLSKMKPEGLKPVQFPGKTDCHPRKGWKNWWECLGFKSTRSSRKQKLKRDIDTGRG